MAQSARRAATSRACRLIAMMLAELPGWTMVRVGASRPPMRGGPSVASLRWG